MSTPKGSLIYSFSSRKAAEEMLGRASKFSGYPKELFTIESAKDKYSGRNYHSLRIRFEGQDTDEYCNFSPGQREGLQFLDGFVKGFIQGQKSRK
jgi:hypothetical protein